MRINHVEISVSHETADALKRTESQRSSRVRVPATGPTKRYSSPGRPTLPAVARCPIGTSVRVANSVENAFRKLLVFRRSSDGSRIAEYTARSSDRVNSSGRSWKATHE